MIEHRVECSVCKESFRPVPSQIKLICNECSGENKLISEFIERWNILLKWYNDIGFDYEIHKGNIKNFIIKEIEKWEQRRDKQ